MLLVALDDPMRRREDFAVNLRKKKKDEIINKKRKRLFKDISGAGVESSARMYRDCPMFTDVEGTDKPSLQAILKKHVPELFTVQFQQMSGTNQVSHKVC